MKELSDRAILNQWSNFLIVHGNYQDATLALARWVEKYQAVKMASETNAVLLMAIPYIMDVLDNPEQLACFKKGVVERDIAMIRACIDNTNKILEEA